jgi:hypothetical protein
VRRRGWSVRILVIQHIVLPHRSRVATGPNASEHSREPTIVHRSAGSRVLNPYGPELLQPRPSGWTAACAAFARRRPAGARRASPSGSSAAHGRRDPGASVTGQLSPSAASVERQLLAMRAREALHEPGTEGLDSGLRRRGPRIEGCAGTATSIARSVTKRRALLRSSSRKRQAIEARPLEAQATQSCASRRAWRGARSDTVRQPLSAQLNMSSCWRSTSLAPGTRVCDSSRPGAIDGARPHVVLNTHRPRPRATDRPARGNLSRGR